MKIHFKDTKIVTIVLGLILIGLLVSSFFVFGNRSSKSTEASDTGTTAASDNMAGMDMPMGSSNNDVSSGTQVSIDNYMFMPGTLKIKTGQTVTWTNKDSVKHSVIANDPTTSGLSSQLLARGETYSYKIDKAGSYPYYCDPHPYMKATIVVED